MRAAGSHAWAQDAAGRRARSLVDSTCSRRVRCGTCVPRRRRVRRARVGDVRVRRLRGAPAWCFKSLGVGSARGMLASEVCRSATCRVALRAGLSAGREVARRRAPSCGVPAGAVRVCVRVQDADMLYVVRCGVLYVVCACPVPRTRARLGCHGTRRMLGRPTVASTAPCSVHTYDL